MSQKTCLQSLLSQSQWHLSPPRPVGRLSVKRIFFLWPGPAYSGEAQLPMMQVTLAVTPH